MELKYKIYEELKKQPGQHVDAWEMSKTFKTTPRMIHFQLMKLAHTHKNIYCEKGLHGKMVWWYENGN